MEIIHEIKDILFYFAVLRNPCIADEYLSYVNSHRDEHCRHRMWHWMKLLRLNIHYRILRRPPYLYGRPVSHMPGTGPRSLLKMHRMLISILLKNFDTIPIFIAEKV